MWFSEKALVFVDTRSAAVAVYSGGSRRPVLKRFAFEGVPGSPGAAFGEALRVARPSVDRLVKELAPSRRGATLLLPIGASFPATLEESAVARVADVAEGDMARFRMSPLLPFPATQAEIRLERAAAFGPGVALGQAIPQSVVAEGERFMSDCGFASASIGATLSTALRGFRARPSVVDVILGDSAYALGVRNARAALESIHVRLLVEGDDPIRRSTEEALRASRGVLEVRIGGASPDAIEAVARGWSTSIVPAFPHEGSFNGPQRFPFLGIFEEGAA